MSATVNVSCEDIAYRTRYKWESRDEDGMVVGGGYEHNRVLTEAWSRLGFDGLEIEWTPIHSTWLYLYRDARDARGNGIGKYLHDFLVRAGLVPCASPSELENFVLPVGAYRWIESIDDRLLADAQKELRECRGYGLIPSLADEA